MNLIKWAIDTVKLYRRLKRDYAEQDRLCQIWKAYLSAPSNVRITNGTKNKF